MDHDCTAGDVEGGYRKAGKIEQSCTPDVSSVFSVIGQLW